MHSKGLWTHKNSLDIFYEVINVQYRGSDYIKVKYQCWNKGFDGSSPWLCSPVLKCKVKLAEFHNWKPYKDKQQ